MPNVSPRKYPVLFSIRVDEEFLEALELAVVLKETPGGRRVAPRGL